MAVNSLVLFNIAATVVILIAFPHLFLSVFCLNHNLPPESIRGLLVEEKTRLGSTPPSCHNKCNNCHPCMAVQVPTMPTHHNQVQDSTLSHAKTMDYFDSSSSSSSYSSSFGGNIVNNKYSNYKPLGWKCRCGGHFYNP